MGLIYDDPDLAALTLTRLAAEESEGPGGFDGRMHEYLSDLEQRNGPAYLELVAITLARFHFKTLDDLARDGTDARCVIARTRIDRGSGAWGRHPVPGPCPPSRAA